MESDSEVKGCVGKTFFWDRIRGFLTGVIETGVNGFALIIAIDAFQAPSLAKSLIVSAGPIGMLLNPISLSLFQRTGLPANRIAAFLFALCSVLMASAAFAQSLVAFMICCGLAFATAAQSMPLLVQIWTRNYPSNKRGSYLAVSMMFAIASSFVFSLLGGWMLDKETLPVDAHQAILAIIACAYALGVFVFWRMPQTPISQSHKANPFANFGYAFSDRDFGIMLLAWMFLGFGNLMLLPMRFEYLLQPQYGIEASKLTVTVLTLVLTSIFRFLSSRFWGALFDRIDFLILRMVLNGLILLSILLFFTTRNVWFMGIGAAVLGMAMGGANISWSLWVTKFAKPELAPAYMSVHTFTTGIRGVLAPFLGYALIVRIGAMNTGIVGASLVLVSILMVYILYRHRQRLRIAGLS